jgi:peptidoglycan/xylan/chitin deacetylase (PgdA/CDA1 family)
VVRILYGHTMRPGDVPNFRRMLRILRRSHEFVTIDEALSLLRAPDASSGRYLAFSFDDGFADNHDLAAPTLAEFGAVACLFISTNFIECTDDYRRWFLRERVHQDETRQPLTWAQVRSLAREGWTIGAHTMDHVNVAALDRDAALAQVLGARDRIADELGVPCKYFSWPYGSARFIPESLLPQMRTEFDATFSGIRSDRAFAFDGAVVNRDHIEPSWPPLHVRYFANRAVSRTTL